MTEPATVVQFPANEVLANSLDELQGPPDYAKPLVDDVAKRVQEINEDITVGEKSLKQQLADMKAAAKQHRDDMREAERLHAERMQTMQERYDNEKSCHDRMCEVRNGWHKIGADAAALQRIIPEAPKPSKPKPRSRAKGKAAGR